LDAVPVVFWFRVGTSPVTSDRNRGAPVPPLAGPANTSFCGAPVSVPVPPWLMGSAADRCVETTVGLLVVPPMSPAGGLIPPAAFVAHPAVVALVASRTCPDDGGVPVTATPRRPCTMGLGYVPARSPPAAEPGVMVPVRGVAGGIWVWYGVSSARSTVAPRLLGK
jgi:hypothetical protein